MTFLASVRSEPLDVQEVIAAVSRHDAGAVATFSGVVRDHSDGHPVTLLEYEAYPSMAEKEMSRIMQGIQAQLPAVKLAAVHRVGALRVGELAVVCAASAPHRRDALNACELLIDGIKESVPVWKREHGPNGPYWVGWQDARCQHTHPTDPGGSADRGEQGAAIHCHHSDARAEYGGGCCRSLDALRIAVLTVSDTRTRDNDESGRLAVELLERAGAAVIDSAIVKDDPEQIRARVLTWVRETSPAAVVVTGGTGIASRDQTLEAISPILVRVIDGFGETFRRLSFDQVGTRAVLSRAMAGTVDSTLVFLLPGSPSALRLGLIQLVIPLLPHAHALLNGSPHQHAQSVLGATP